MTPDIRPRPSPGSRIYSKEGTPPPNQGITQRVGRWTLSQGWVLNSHAYVIVSPMCEPLHGLRTIWSISREKLSPLEQTTQQHGHHTPIPTFSNNQGWASHLNSTLLKQWVKKLLSLSSTATQRWTLYLHPLLSHCLGFPKSLSLAWTTQLNGMQADHPDRKCPCSLSVPQSSHTGRGRPLQTHCCWGPKGFLPAFSYWPLPTPQLKRFRVNL